MSDGESVLVQSVSLFSLLLLAFLGYGFFLSPNLNQEEPQQEVLPATEVLSVVDQSNPYAYECPETFTVIEVPNDYPTIQKAIDAAVGGTIIRVAPGIYVESITLKPQICLVAEEFGKSELQSLSDVIVQASNQSKIQNFKINGLDRSSIGISVVNAQGVNIEINTFENLEHAILSNDNSELSVNANSFRFVDYAVSIENSNFFVEQNNIHANLVGLDVVSSYGEVVGLVFEGGEYAVKSENSDLFLNKNIFRNQTSAALQLSNEGSYEIGDNFFDNVNEEILYK